MKSKVQFALVVLFTTSVVFAKESKDIYELGFEDLTKIIVTSPSKREETIAEAPSVVTVVTAKEIELFGALDLQEVLERILGVQSHNDRGNGRTFLGIRSDSPKPYDNQHVLMLLNGTAFNRDSYNEGIWTQAGLVGIPVQMVERIEVIRGPGSVLHGSKAFQGVINIVTKKAIKDEVSATYGYGSWNTDIGEAYLTINEGELQIDFGLTYVHTDGWDLKTNGTTSTLSADVHEKNYGILTTLNYRNFNAQVWYATTDQFTTRPSSPPNQTNPAEGLTKNEHYFVDLGYKHSFTEEWTLKTKASIGGHRTDHVVFPEVLEVDYETDDSQFEINLEGATSEKGNLLIGGVVNYISGKIPGGTFLNKPRWNDTWYSFYSQFDYQLNDSLKIVAGGQYNNTDIADIFVPRLGLIVNFTPEWGMKLLYGEAFRAPSIAEKEINVRPVLIGNSSLDFELIKTYDLQFFYNTDKLQSSLTFFQNDQEDLIIRDRSGPITQFQNRDELTIRGIEFESKYAFSQGWFFSGGITYQENHDGNGLDDFTLNPDLEAKLGIYYNSTKFSFGIFDSFTSAYKDIEIREPGNANVNPNSNDYHDISANLRIKLHEILNWSSEQKLELDFHVTNLLDDDIFRPTVGGAVQGLNTHATDGGSFYSVKLKYSF